MDNFKIDLIKDDYIRQLTERGAFTFARSVRNIDKVKACSVDLNCSKDFSECTIYHELDHIRKGERNPGGELDVNDITPEGKITPRKAAHGIFFGEGITEYMAIHMYQNSKFFRPQDRAVVENRKLNGHYAANLKILEGIADVLDMPPVKLCELIDLRHTFGEQTLEWLLPEFDMIEKRLDFYGTAQMINTGCEMGEITVNEIKGTGVTEEVQSKVNKVLKEVTAEIEQLKKKANERSL